MSAQCKESCEKVSGNINIIFYFLRINKLIDPLSGARRALCQCKVA